jgi:hypothetical protein
VRSSGDGEVEAIQPVQGPIQVQSQLEYLLLQSVVPQRQKSQLRQQLQRELALLLLRQAQRPQLWVLICLIQPTVVLDHVVAYLLLACHLLTYSSHPHAYEDLYRREEFVVGAVVALSDQLRYQTRLQSEA